MREAALWPNFPLHCDLLRAYFPRHLKDVDAFRDSHEDLAYNNSTFSLVYRMG